MAQVLLSDRSASFEGIEMMNSMTASSARLLTTLALVFGTVKAFAVPAVSLDNVVGQNLSNPPFTLGWAFTTTSAITVTALGLFDSDQDGLAERHALGLWNSSGTLIASTILGAGTADPLTNQFRYSALVSGVTLNVGETYRIGALFESGSDALIFPGTAVNFTTSSAITFGGASFASGGTLANPVNTSSKDVAYFGPNFLFDAAATVPEPTTLLLTALALSVVGATRRVRKDAETV